MLTLERPAFNGAMLSTGYIGTGFDLNSIAAVGGGRHHRHSGQPPGIDLLRTGGHCDCTSSGRAATVTVSRSKRHPSVIGDHARGRLSPYMYYENMIL